MSAPVYYLPDTLRNWPWERIISPHYLEAQAESVAWLESFHPFSPAAQRAFNKCDFSLVSALTFPKATLSDAHFFTLDEHTDTLDAAGAKILCGATMVAIENPDKPRPEGEPLIGKIARQFWKRASVNALKTCHERFQAARRSTSYICTVDEYMAARCANIGSGSDPSFAFLEISLGVDLPHEVMEHPAIVSDTTDMIILAPDMCSYKKEVISNDADYNAVTMIMVNNNTDVAGGIQWISDRHDEIVENFLAVRDDVLHHHNGVPSWGKIIDAQVEKYIDGRGGQWIRGHDEWNFGSGLYSGDEGRKIQQSRAVVIAQRFQVYKSSSSSSLGTYNPSTWNSMCVLVQRQR
ncbi:terpenoid synthase [Mycena vulgaris]|nr:terpenoid synthase [Mycena vulgaris]